MKKTKFRFKIGQLGEPLEELRSKAPEYFEQKGERMALSLFRYAADSVPAYKRLLKTNKIKADGIRTARDFELLPILDKNSYLRSGNYPDLFPGGAVPMATTLAATSGSSGEPFFVPRGEAEDAQYQYIASLFLKNQFQADRLSTLGIIGFGMGIWIGGIFTYKNFNVLAKDGLKLSLAPVGPNKDTFLKVLKEQGRYFDQVILMGYPPFIKDIIDEAEHQKFDWSPYRIRVLTAAEGFSEDFRNHVSERIGLRNPLVDFINIYGTVEMGTMAHETALANLIRREAVHNKQLFQALFPEADRLPTLAQYHPYLTYFEADQGELLVTGYASSIPLVRYRTSDKGGVIKFDEMMERCAESGVDIKKLARECAVDKTVLNLPFVYVYERTDLAASLFGILIYPEYIKSALENKNLAAYVTGRFAIQTKNDVSQAQYLEINVELRQGYEKVAGISDTMRRVIVQALIDKSSEYSYLYASSSKVEKKKLVPRVILWPHDSSHLFDRRSKQKWVMK